MKKKTNIKTLIRTIVREEVAMAINEVITELKQPTQQVSQPKPKKKIVEKKQFTKNAILNEVMNETAQSEEWKTMGGETYDSSKMNDVMGKSYGDMMNNNNPDELINSMGFAEKDKAPDFLKKDYSKVVKAMSNKKGK